jgi:hypothetical protein
MRKSLYCHDKDLELIRSVKENGDSEAMKQLINFHSGIFETCLKQSLSSDYDVFKNEIHEDKDYHMYRLAMNYDPSKNMKYPTWVGQNVKWMCMNIVNRSRPWESLEEGSFDCSYEQEIENVEQLALDELSNLAKSYPDERVSAIIEGRYFQTKPKPWHKLSAELKTSQISLTNLHNKFILWAKPKMKKYI